MSVTNTLPILGQVGLKTGPLNINSLLECDVCIKIKDGFSTWMVKRLNIKKACKHVRVQFSSL